MRKRRCEILLPLTLNDGSPIDPGKFSRTLEELIAQFGGVSFLPQGVRGAWIHEGIRYEEESRCVMVEVDDTTENEHFFIDFKANLLERFEQLEIYMIWYPIERV